MMKKLSLVKILKEAQDFEFAPFIEKFKRFVKSDETMGSGSNTQRRIYFEFAPGIGVSVVNGAGTTHMWELAPIRNGEIDENHPLFKGLTQFDSFPRMKAYEAEQMLARFAQFTQKQRDTQQTQSKFQVPPQRLN